MTRLARPKTASARRARRARIVPLAAQGMRNKDAALALCAGRMQVGHWRDRYAEEGLQGIERDLPRRAPPSKVDMTRLLVLTIQTRPEATMHWRTRKMAAGSGVSVSTVMRRWQSNGLTSHFVRRFKISCDPKFGRNETLRQLRGRWAGPHGLRPG